MSNGLSVTNVVAAKELAALLLQEGLWKAAVDPTTFKSYYFHKGTKERVWSLEEHIRKLLQGGQTASGVHQLYRANPSGDAAGSSSSSPARRVIRQSATTVSTVSPNNHREGGGTALASSSSSATAAAAAESSAVISASVAVVPTTTTATPTPPPQRHTVDGATVVPATTTTTDMRPFSTTTTTTTSTGGASVPPAVADHAQMSTLAATAPPAAEVTGSESSVGVSRPRHSRTAASASSSSPTPPRAVVASTSSSSLSPTSREVGSHRLLRVAVGVPLAHVWSVRSEFLRAASSSSSSPSSSSHRYSSLLMNVPFLLQRYAPQMSSNLPNVLLGALAHPPPPSTSSTITTSAAAVPPHRFLAVAVVQQQQTKKPQSSSSTAGMDRSIVEVRGLCEVAFTSAPPQCVVRQLVAVPLVDAATIPSSHVTAASKVATNHQHTIVLDHPILRRLPHDADSGALFLWSSAATVTLPTRGGGSATGPTTTARLTLSFHGALRIVTPMAMAVPWSVVRFQPQAAPDVEAAATSSSLVSPQRERRVAEEGAGFVPLSVAESSTLFASEEVAWCGGALRDLERVAETLTSATDVSKSGGWRTPHRNQYSSSQQDHSARPLDASSLSPPPTNGMKSSSPSILVLRDLLDDATMKRTERPPLLRSPSPGMVDRRDGRHHYPPTSAAKRSSTVTTTNVQQILQSAAYRKGYLLQQHQPQTAHHHKAGTVRTFGAEGDPLRPSASPSLLYRRESLHVQTTPRPGAVRAGAYDEAVHHHPTWMDRRATTTTTPPGGRSSCPPSIAAVHQYGQRPQSSGPSSRNMTSKRSGGNNTAEDGEDDPSQMVVSLEDAELFEALMQQLDALEESQL